jgi:hypothetical protein
MRIALALLALLAAVAAGAQPPPTDLRAVDAFIDAPRAVFGRTRMAVERALGAPVAVEARVLAGAGGRRDAGARLAYRGVVIDVAGTAGAVRRVQLTEGRWPLPHGLTIGTPRARVEQALGEPQAASDASLLYLYSDAYPDTVEFAIRDGRVQRIEWLYAPPD